MAPFAETPILSHHTKSPIEVSKEPDLLDGWWTSEYLFALERRAVFSKTWICIAHRSRFTKPGDYISMEIAGLPILIILGKDHIVRAFHNVCRHRAYTVTKKPAGSSLVLGCRYHGWSYDTKGNLVKAPQFDGIQGFKKSENGLFKIQTCTDRGGFIYINLSAGQLLEAPDCQETLELATEHGISAGSKWITGWELSGGFNWKTVGASDRTGIGTSAASAAGNWFIEKMVSMFRRPQLDVAGAKLVKVAPLTTVAMIPKCPLWLMLTTIPISAGQCTVKCDVFSTDATTLNKTDKEVLSSFVASHIHALEQSYEAVKIIRPFQEPLLLPLLKGHLKLERLAGMEIFPGKREEGKSEGFCRAERVCKELDQIAKAGNVLRSTVSGLDW
ncbi:Rieske [2Fe-2S] iron-sulfur domain-containing protein [Clohesyomyces aquaticus]|uniref:Rieske [2Fe-2S] iron-sulfur domain-containing protein n=1 Tax=Clohesyomyces aquaticus TaxID=1231657 RepID=A0A1Y1ZPN6_9PLEO|nr:Rieske [2Fe-2S] iron-sulfur domain-containing protein [Clohesyomyces aquaticus]